MNSEDVIVYLTSLVAIGIIVVGLLATLLHSTTLAPIVIIGIEIESIEKLCFVITFIAIVCSFILLYKPA